MYTTEGPASRNLIILYEILIKFMKELPYPMGICYSTYMLFKKRLVTEEEYNLLRKHFKSNPRPRFRWYHNIFNPLQVNPSYMGYYWELKGNKRTRVRFLKSILRKLKKDENLKNY